MSKGFIIVKYSDPKIRRYWQRFDMHPSIAHINRPYLFSIYGNNKGFAQTPKDNKKSRTVLCVNLPAWFS